MTIITAPDQHLAAVPVTCPSGHITTTQKAGGEQILCGPCNEAGQRVPVLVPVRPGETRKRRPARPGHRGARCRGCGASAAGQVWDIQPGGSTSPSAFRQSRAPRTSRICSSAPGALAHAWPGRSPTFSQTRERHGNGHLTAVAKASRN